MVNAKIEQHSTALFPVPLPLGTAAGRGRPCCADGDEFPQDAIVQGRLRAAHQPVQPKVMADRRTKSCACGFGYQYLRLLPR